MFHNEADFAAFGKLLREAGARIDVRLLEYCLLSNHFHLPVWPRRGGDPRACRMRLTTAHVRRYRQHYHSSGHVWQGRFRSFPIQEDDHLLSVHRYLERNPVRAGLVERAQDWLWSGAAPQRGGLPVLAASPVPPAVDWLTFVNDPQTEAEVESLREWIRRRRPYGDAALTQRTARQMSLEASLRPRGRPPKKPAQQATLFS